MRYKKKISFRNLLFSSTSLSLIGLLVLILISLPLINDIKKRININKEIANLDQEIVNLENKNTDLKGLITYLNSDQFVEEQAKLNLNYKKEGEELTIIKDANSPDINTNQTNNQDLNSIYNIEGLGKNVAKEKNKNIEKWIKYFWN